MNAPFYEKGLEFSCRKDCSKCCGGSPGYVFLDEDEILRLQNCLGVDQEFFLDNYTKAVGDRISLRDVEEDNWNCILLKDGKCSVYENRPLQCRTFPFWPQNIITKAEWEETKTECPGIGEGRHYTKEEIEAIAMGDETIDSVK
jgi:uncharacterized protein